MGVLGEMFGRKRIHEDADAAQGGQRWALGPIDLENGVVTLQAAGGDTAARPEPDGAGNAGTGEPHTADEPGAAGGLDTADDPDGPGEGRG